MTTTADRDGADREADGADLRPWTIKSVPLETRRKAKDAADKQDMTQAEWITQAVNLMADRQARDGIIPPGRPEADRIVTIDLPGFAAALTATVAAIQASGGRVPKVLGREAARMLRLQLGLPVRLTRRQTARLTIDQNGQTGRLEAGL
nr:hypothetical protein [uncultured Rhodopila sp.]